MTQIFESFSLTEIEHQMHYREKMGQLLKSIFLASSKSCVRCGGYVFLERCPFEIKREGTLFQLGVAEVAFCLNASCMQITAQGTSVLKPKEYCWKFGAKEVIVKKSNVRFFKRCTLQRITFAELQRVRELVEASFKPSSISMVR